MISAVTFGEPFTSSQGIYFFDSKLPLPQIAVHLNATGNSQKLVSARLIPLRGRWRCSRCAPSQVTKIRAIRCHANGEEEEVPLLGTSSQIYSPAAVPSTLVFDSLHFEPAVFDKGGRTPTFISVEVGAERWKGEVGFIPPPHSSHQPQPYRPGTVASPYYDFQAPFCGAPAPLTQPSPPRTAREHFAVNAHALTCCEVTCSSAMCSFVAETRRHAAECTSGGTCCEVALAVQHLTKALQSKSMSAQQHEAVAAHHDLVERRLRDAEHQASSLRSTLEHMRAVQKVAPNLPQHLLKLTLINDQAAALMGHISQVLVSAEAELRSLGELDAIYTTWKPRLDGMVWSQVLLLEDLQLGDATAAAAAERILAMERFVADDGRRLADNTQAAKEACRSVQERVQEAQALLTKAQHFVRDAEPALLALQQHSQHTAWAVAPRVPIMAAPATAPAATHYKRHRSGRAGRATGAPAATDSASDDDRRRKAPRARRSHHSDMTVTSDVAAPAAALVAVAAVGPAVDPLATLATAASARDPVQDSNMEMATPTVTALPVATHSPAGQWGSGSAAPAVVAAH